MNIIEWKSDTYDKVIVVKINLYKQNKISVFLFLLGRKVGQSSFAVILSVKILYQIIQQC